MCDKIEELEKKIENLEKTNGQLWELVWKKNTKIQELHNDYNGLNDSYVKLTQDHDELKKENEKLNEANNILTEECNKALMLNDKHGGEAKDLKAAIKTILNSIYGVDTDGIIRKMMVNGGKI